jgi:hypothetical protein
LVDNVWMGNSEGVSTRDGRSGQTTGFFVVCFMAWAVCILLGGQLLLIIFKFVKLSTEDGCGACEGQMAQRKMMPERSMQD